MSPAQRVASAGFSRAHSERARLLHCRRLGLEKGHLEAPVSTNLLAAEVEDFSGFPKARGFGSVIIRIFTSSSRIRLR